MRERVYNSMRMITILRLFGNIVSINNYFTIIVATFKLGVFLNCMKQERLITNITNAITIANKRAETERIYALHLISVILT